MTRGRVTALLWRRLRGLGTVVASLALAALAAAPPAFATDCLTAAPPSPTAPPNALRFGITPQAAGSAGPTQGDVSPENQSKALKALHRLKPNKRQLVLRLNRLFWSDGQAGIDRFADLIDGYGAEGLQSEVQVRYHPPPGGDSADWESFVRAAVDELATLRHPTSGRPYVVAMSITNEANFPLSPNTSDGAYAGVLDALVAGIVAARDEAAKVGRPDLALGFTVMWRWDPNSDQRFWEDLGRRATETPEFRSALDYVGLQAYPGLVWPPTPLPGRSAGDEIAEALTLVRDCYMPKAGLGVGVDLWITENGYATNLGRTESQQLADLTSTIDAAHRLSGTLGVTDYRYFNLRDNRSDGTDLFDAVGLLRDDYSEKPAFATYRSLVHSYGELAP
jgi:hypothetical protein